MKLTIEEIKTLSTWEEHFRTAVKAGWSRNPGRAALETIWKIYTGATGDSRRFNDNCNSCIMHLLRDCGRLYFAERDEMIARQNVQVAEVDADPVKSVEVKVKKKKTTKA